MTKKGFGTRVIEGLEALVDSLQKKQPIGEKFTVRDVELDLRPAPYDPIMVKKTRKILGVSQAIFAKFLGVSVRTVRAWEQGINPPSDIACRFMDEIRRDPEHWKRRLVSAIVPKSPG